MVEWHRPRVAIGGAMTEHEQKKVDNILEAGGVTGTYITADALAEQVGVDVAVVANYCGGRASLDKITVITKAGPLPAYRDSSS